MLNGENFIEKVLFIFFWCIFCVSMVNAQHQDDINPETFNGWDSIQLYGRFWYVDDSDNKPKRCRSKSLYVFDGTYYATHNCDKNGDGVYHFHYQYDWGDEGEGCEMVSESECNAYWDYRFQFYEKCCSEGFPSNRQNCYAWACEQALDSLCGNYNYAFDYDMFYYFVFLGGGDCVSITPKSNVQAGDFIVYTSNDHASFVYNVSGSQPHYLKWKIQASCIYMITDTGWKTPICYGTGFGSIDPENDDINENLTIINQGWSWDDAGIGSESDAHVYRANP